MKSILRKTLNISSTTMRFVAGGAWVAAYYAFAEPSEKIVVDNAIDVMNSTQIETVISDFDYVKKSMQMIANPDSSIEDAPISEIANLSDSLTKYIRQGTDPAYKQEFKKNLETYISNTKEQLEDIQDDFSANKWWLALSLMFFVPGINDLYDMYKKRD